MPLCWLSSLPSFANASSLDRAWLLLVMRDIDSAAGCTTFKAASTASSAAATTVSVPGVLPAMAECCGAGCTICTKCCADRSGICCCWSCSQVAWLVLLSVAQQMLLVCVATEASYSWPGPAVSDTAAGPCTISFEDSLAAATAPTAAISSCLEACPAVSPAAAAAAGPCCSAAMAARMRVDDSAAGAGICRTTRGSFTVLRADCCWSAA